LAGIQQGNTANRPQNPVLGLLYYNAELGYFESYTSNGWFPIAVAPGIPSSVVATNQGSARTYNNGQTSVAFTPNTSGGAANSFIVRPTPTTSPATFTGSSSPITITNLVSNTQYTYTVIAASTYGNSSESTSSTGVVATTVPQAPTIGAVTSGNTLATVAYTAGATGGSSVTSYTATSSPGGLTGTGSSPITVSGLTNGTAYTFTVTATNANGTSAASAASNSVTPLATYSIGSTGPGGGTVFYDAGSIQSWGRYLEAATSATSPAWTDATRNSLGGSTLVGTSQGIGTGLANTNAMVAAQGGGAGAASLCKNYRGGGLSDWFLPSKDELSELYNQRAIVGGFLLDNDGYYSSSEYSNEYTWAYNFAGNYSFSYSRGAGLYARAVRAF
jgi:hypothetical protein